MTRKSKRGRGALLERAQFTLGMTQKTLGEMFGVSAKTMMRWQGGGNYALTAADLEILLASVHPRDPDLARELAESHGTTLQALGIGAHGQAATDVPTSSKPIHALAESLLFVASDAADVSPRVMRPALLAAFERAEKAGVTVADVVKMLKRDA